MSITLENVSASLLHSTVKYQIHLYPLKKIKTVSLLESRGMYNISNNGKGIPSSQHVSNNIYKLFGQVMTDKGIKRYIRPQKND